MLSKIEHYLDESQRRAFAEVKAEAFAEAFAEVKAEAFAEAKAKATAEAILKILAKRGLSMTDADRARVMACTDLATLDGWFDRVLSVATIDELFA